MWAAFNGHMPELIDLAERDASAIRRPEWESRALCFRNEARRGIVERPEVDLRSASRSSSDEHDRSSIGGDGDAAGARRRRSKIDRDVIRHRDRKDDFGSRDRRGNLASPPHDTSAGHGTEQRTGS
jgi:hypothetical protein